MEQKLLPPPRPWYRTRIFWGIIYLLLLVFAISKFYLLTSAASSFSILTSWQITIYAVFSSGGALFYLLGASLGKTIGLLSSLLFYLITLFCVYKTFSEESVLIRYPILAILLFGTGIIASVLYTSSL